MARIDIPIPKVEAIELEVECAHCGRSLLAEFVTTTKWSPEMVDKLKVQPCPDCLDAAHDEG